MKLIAVMEVFYASRTRNPGDPFEASEQDARILVGLGKAVAPVVDTPPQPAKASGPVPPPLIARDDPPLFEEPAEKETAEEERPKKRTYKRRDLVAEE
jgi:hypothetical protein